ncbi:1,4-dihydroxy-2-naphthoate polyprenyltransferase [Vagococcus zengguangii]|uniref:1,4-dihydroxy-2-naphthoate polyprenyltransferase n=1 Tax=Vagococcus zengguangii TaxID=2571750 RepID=A0A4D7CS50_9ENTE|nr:1,4-dihydroxy-2-naphthoate polyprenyltransferase [Vagococcus zengguangii]QCI85462.1 1,4-dihydroxy-2-naphthoate polyprenyltransferase [Vagococcus zengguangii]TLG80007.1 1,4-dihydroxy-2-naphthoate polyprenyltransferase [Vagococcus zengguangii]
MNLNVFFKLVEIQTKLASLFPFIIGVLFSQYYFDQIKWSNTIIFFLGMLVFDMCTTAINNYMDFRKAKNETYKYETNIVGQAGLSDKTVQTLIFAMIGFAMIVGIYLSVKTGWLLLVMGGLCCLIGIFYTFGPVPLSRMPLGELFSGVTMGLGIFLITVYINTYDLGFFFLSLKDWQFNLVGDLRKLIPVGLASLPMIFTIANIMLANNLCDLDEDITNHRYTLPYYIGRKNGILLFNILMYSCYLVMIVGVIFKVYHPIMLIVLLTLPLIMKNVKAFSAKQVKRETFVISIKNLVIFNSAQIIGLIASILLK